MNTVKVTRLPAQVVTPPPTFQLELSQRQAEHLTAMLMRAVKFNDDAEPNATIGGTAHAIYKALTSAGVVEPVAVQAKLVGKSYGIVEFANG